MANRVPGHEEVAAERFITPELEAQVDSFVDMAQGYNQRIPEYRRRDPENYSYLRDFYKKALSERNKRAEEVESSEYWDVEKLAESQFPIAPYLVLCMDGRVLPPLIFGMTYGIGGSIRVPGGILQEFDRGEDGKLFLRRNSVYSERLNQALGNADTIAQIFDSHIGCAARNAEEESRGAHLHGDAGLYRDVMFKKEMVDATQRYVSERNNGKRVMSIQTSFNPHNGFLFMGLETEAALSAAESKRKDGHEPEFTGAILHELAEQGKIISTEHLADELRELFKAHGDFTMDWKNRFVETAGNFWRSVAAMKDDARPVIEAKLKTIYPELDSEEESSQQELEERTVLILANAFSGYMLNKLGLTTEHMHEEGSQEHAYEYGDHHEEFIKIYEGGQPPYETSAFVIWSLDHKNLPANIELAAALVRKNRREGRVTDPFGYFKDPSTFEKAVVPLVVHEIVREPLEEAEWERLSKIDWSDLSEINWDNMSADEFSEYLLGKGITDYRIIKNINNLRERMAVIVDPDTPLGTHVVDQFKIALPTIIGKNRKNYFVVPFFKAGHKDNVAQVDLTRRSVPQAA
jgi:hypothetical protein